MALAKLYPQVTGIRNILTKPNFPGRCTCYTSRKDVIVRHNKPVWETGLVVGHAAVALYVVSPGMADGSGNHRRQRKVVSKQSTRFGIILFLGENLYHERYRCTLILRGFQVTLWVTQSLLILGKLARVIGNVYRIIALSCFMASKYFDVLERTIRIIRSIILDGGSSFIPTHLASSWRLCMCKPWFGCACCPSNISRFISCHFPAMYVVKR